MKGIDPLKGNLKTVIGGVEIDHEYYKTSMNDHFKNKVAVFDDNDK